MKHPCNTLKDEKLSTLMFSYSKNYFQNASCLNSTKMFMCICFRFYIKSLPMFLLLLKTDILKLLKVLLCYKNIQRGLVCWERLTNIIYCLIHRHNNTMESVICYTWKQHYFSSQSCHISRSVHSFSTIDIR